MIIRSTIIHLLCDRAATLPVIVPPPPVRAQADETTFLSQPVLGASAGRFSGRGRPGRRSATAAAGSNAPPADRLAVLLESDAAVLDLHVDGHRVAFNRAFDVRRPPTADVSHTGSGFCMLCQDLVSVGVRVAVRLWTLKLA